MTLSRAELRRLVKAEMDTDPTHDLAHLDRVWANAERIAEGEGLQDRAVLMAATYLHDLVNLPKSHPDRAQASCLSARKARALLAGHGYSAAQLAGMSHAIEAHSYSAAIPPRSAEARILRDADRLDSLGAIGTARTFSVAGALDLMLYDPEDPFAVSRALEETAFALDHWKVKLLGLGAGLLTRTAREMARDRLAFMEHYLGQLASELGHPLPSGWRSD